jgi:hypothetical protein
VPGASSAHQQVLRLISFKRRAIRVFDADGHGLSLEELRLLADEGGGESDGGSEGASATIKL